MSNWHSVRMCVCVCVCVYIYICIYIYIYIYIYVNVGSCYIGIIATATRACMYMQHPRLLSMTGNCIQPHT